MKKKTKIVERGITPKDVIYLIMPDRFASGHSNCCKKDVDRDNPWMWHGGTLRGIIEHLDYIKELGVTAIWLTPVFENNNPIESAKYASYHGYGVTNFKKIDPHFGSLYDFKELVNQAHAKEIKVIIDLVMNHCGIGHHWVNEQPDYINVLDNKTNPRLSNYNLTTVLGEYASKYDKETTVKGWFTKQMPDIDLTNKDVQTYFIDVVDYWIKEAGVDGLRLDTYLYADDKAMREWQNKLWEKHPGFPIIAETWVPNTAYTAEIQKRMSQQVCYTSLLSRLKKTICRSDLNERSNIPIIMDFAFQKAIDKAFDNNKSEEQQRALYDHFLYDYLYDNPSMTLAFLDNHDMRRWYYEHEDLDIAKQAMGILLTVPRIPQILYGTEILSTGDNEGTGDGNWRNDFPGGWEEDPVNKFISKGRTSSEEDFFKFTQALLKWRKDSSAVTCGKMVQFLPQNGVYVYCRYNEIQRFVVFANLLGFNSKIELCRYKEIFDGKGKGKNIITKAEIDLSSRELIIQKNQILIIQL